jgi:hypothetical protein
MGSSRVPVNAPLLRGGSLVTAGAIDGWDPRIGSAISRHATPTEYAKCRQAPITAIQGGYQQTQDPRGFCELARAFNPVGTIRGRLTSQA